MNNPENLDFQMNSFIEGRLDAVRRGATGPDSPIRTSLDALSEDGPLDGASRQNRPVADHLLKVAAVSGRTDPSDMLPGELGKEARTAILSSIVHHFDVVSLDGKITWCLRIETRTELLAMLKAENQLEPLLEGPLPETDRTGILLRSLIQGKDLGSEYQHPSPQLLQAIEWLQGIVDDLPDVDRLRGRFRRANLLNDQQVLLTNGFFGRRSERNLISSFLDKAHRSGKVTPLLISGVGGSGKSTLVAKLCEEQLVQGTNLLVVLDFDRVGIDPSDLLWLTQELCRQLGNQVENLYKSFKSLRDSFRGHKSETEHYGTEYSSKSASLYRDLLGQLAGLLEAYQPDGKKLVLILDTFEEVVQRNLQGILFRWTSDLSEYFGSQMLRVIICGRELKGLEYELKRDHGFPVFAHLQLDGFDTETTRSFLRRLEVPERFFVEILKGNVIPRRPLELKLLAKVINDEPNLRVEDLKNEILKGGGNDLFVGIIYRRILMRITNPMVRRLACPGLILRFLDAETIRHVVFPALSFPEIAMGEAEKILDELATYTWLSQKDSQGRVWHRKDLRKSMLKLMINEDPELSRRIHLLAIEHFSSSSATDGRIEAFYHRLMCMDDPDGLDRLLESEAKDMWPLLGTYIEDFPQEVTVLFRFLAKRQVREQDIDMLPAHRRSQALSIVSRQHAQKGFFKKASAYIFSDVKDWDRAYDLRPQAVLGPWEANVLFNVGCWDCLERAHIPARKSRTSRDMINYAYLSVLPINRDLVIFDGDLLGLHFLEKLTDSLRRGFGMGGREVFYKFLTIMTIDKQYLDRGYGQFESLGESIGRSVNSRNLVEQDLVFFKLIFDGRLPADQRFSFELPLDRRWLEKFSAGQEDDIKRMLMELSHHGWKNAVSALRHIRRIETSMGFSVEKYGTEMLATLLSNQFPEMRNPVKYAISDALQRGESSFSLAEMLDEFVFLQILELKDPGTFVREMEDGGELYLDDYIELVDRAGKLGELAMAAYKYTSDHNLSLIAQHLYHLGTLRENMIKRVLKNF